VTVLSSTRARIKALPADKQKSVEAEIALALARRLSREPQAALSKELRAVLADLEQDKSQEQGDGVDDLAAAARLKLLPGGAAS
jgi:hypothetical protein